MGKCKTGVCEHGMGDMCCQACSIQDCKDRCDCEAVDCVYFVPEGESTELTLFQSKAMAVMQGIAELDRQKKMLEAQDKALRQELQEAMDKYGVKKFENDILKITYVEPTTRETIDSKKLKEELPAVAAKYTKISQVKGSVRIEVK